MGLEFVTEPRLLTEDEVGFGYQDHGYVLRMTPAMRLAGKVAIISGAASGMGAATARLFAREGAKVVVADMLEHEGRAVADSIKSNSGEARFQKLDVASD